jgi:hypothetical protein
MIEIFEPFFNQKDDKCAKMSIADSVTAGLSPFLVIPDSNGKEKIGSLLTLLLSQYVEVAYYFD